MSWVQSIMGRGVPLGRVFGIPLSVSFSLLPLLAIMLILLTADLQYGVWNLPFAGALLFLLYGSVVAHELGHALVARHYGIRTAAINLHLFGGVAQITQEPSRPRHEFWIAVAGPAVSVSLAFMLGSIALLALNLNAPAGVMDLLVFAVAANLLLGVFNLLPGFPMDGGRVLRAFLWARWNSYARATRVASRVGEGVGWTLSGLGILGVLGVIPGTSIMTVLVGMFIVGLARAERRRLEWREKMQRAQAAVDPGWGGSGGSAPGWTQVDPGVGTTSPEPAPARDLITVRFPDGRVFEFVRDRR